MAIVHDWLDAWRGGENVLAEVAAMYPQADLFALVDFLPDAARARLAGRRATTSFLQHVPGARRHFRKLLPLFPRAIASLDVSGYDLVVSISHAVAKGVRVRAGQRHVAYCLTPMRYAWDLRDAYFRAGTAAGWLRPLADPVLDRLCDWDRASNAGVTAFAAISEFIAARIARHYGRTAQVIYPPVDTAWFTPGAAPQTFPSHSAFALQTAPKVSHPGVVCPSSSGLAFAAAKASWRRVPNPATIMCTSETPSP